MVSEIVASGSDKNLKIASTSFQGRKKFIWQWRVKENGAVLRDISQKGSYGPVKIGISDKFGSDLKVFMSSMPSIYGILRSVIIRLTTSVPSFSRASSPFSAKTTEYPLDFK